MSSPAIDPLPAAGDDVRGGLSVASGLSRWLNDASRRYQHLLDRSTPHAFARWICFSLVALAYIVRVYVIEGFYVVSYGLGIYILNLLIGFLSPQVDPEIQDADAGPTLPTKGSDEFRPFVRRLPEFKFWRYGFTREAVGVGNTPSFVNKKNTFLESEHVRHSLARAFCIAFVMTFFPMFDVPVFWPILLMYWLVLFVVTMKRQINHMIKYKYVPFSIGKQRYTGKKSVPDEDASFPKN